MTSLMELPAELHEMIIGFLPTRVVIIMTLVSKYFRLLIFKGYMGPSLVQLEKMCQSMTFLEKLNFEELLVQMFLYWRLPQRQDLMKVRRVLPVYYFYSHVRFNEKIQAFFKANKKRKGIRALARIVIRDEKGLIDDWKRRGHNNLVIGYHDDIIRAIKRYLS
jgi:hypothetical protein